MTSSLRDLLGQTADRIADYREGLAAAPVHATATPAELRAALGGPLADRPVPPAAVLDRLVAGVAPGLVACAGPRYFGFVVGGALDAATCADLLAIGWDQVAFNAVTSPGAAVVEEIAGGWLKELLGIPASASVGFVTGGQAANTVALAVARHHVLAQAGWDVERDGLVGAPRVRLVVGEERHATVDRAARLLGLGTAAVEPVPAHADGTIDVEALDRVLGAGPAGPGPVAPAIVCVQAGNVNTGAFDDLVAAREVTARHGAWLHVDGAFGLWAAASPAYRHLVRGIEAADSWACDGHKWLNVPYDSGFTFCAHPESHVAAMSYTAAYLVGQGDGAALRAPSDFVPESSRRARGFATWAALQELGRDGVASLVERCCQLARRFAAALEAVDGIEVVNDVVLNQVLVSFGDDARTDAVIAAVQDEGTCWFGATTWAGRRLARISVSNWSTTEDDIDRSAAAVLAAAAATRAA